MLELTTKQRLDRDNAHSWPGLLENVQDLEARGFIHRCGPHDTTCHFDGAGGCLGLTCQKLQNAQW